MKLGVICYMWMHDRRFFMSFAEKRAWKAGGTFVYRSIHVEFCPTWESAPLVSLSSVPSLLSKGQRHLLFQQSSQAPFREGHSSSAREGSEFCRAAPRQRPSVYVRGHHPVARKFGYNFILVRNYPANSPDLSPMDYSMNGIFKCRLWKWKARCVKGLKRTRSGQKCLSIFV